MRRIELGETGRTRHALTPDEGRLLAASDVVTAIPVPSVPGQWTITARRKVGVAQIGDLEVWIAPKLTIDRLLFLVGYARNPKGWRDDTVELDVQEGLVPAVGQLLWRQTERALRQGLIQGYRTVEETSYVMRGRLREHGQIRRHHGRAIPMEVRHDDFTADVPENQILLAAIGRMLAVPRLDLESRHRLAVLRTRLADVATSIRGTTLPSWQPTRLNQRYHAALRLAEVVWQATSPEHARGSLAVTGFLFDLPTVFEDFVTVALSEELHARHGGTAHLQHPCYLDEAGAVRIIPDLVWKLRGRFAAVVDAKYKQERPAGYPDTDLYQLLAYCTALHVPCGHLVYAKGNATPARYVVQHAGIELVCHALDLTRPPDELLARVRDLADELAAAEHLDVPC